MNIWKDINPERIKVDDFIACIEIEQGSKNKYELDKETGLIILDRVLYTSTVGDIKECNGVSIVFCDEICDYTFIPYDGKLKNIAEYRNNRRSFSNSQIYTMNYKKRG